MQTARVFCEPSREPFKFLRAEQFTSPAMTSACGYETLVCLICFISSIVCNLKLGLTFECLEEEG